MLDSIAERRAMAAMRHQGLAQRAGLPVTATDAEITTALRRMGLVEFLNTGSSRRRSMWMEPAKARHWAQQGWGSIVLPSVHSEDYP